MNNSNIENISKENSINNVFNDSINTNSINTNSINANNDLNILNSMISSKTFWNNVKFDINYLKFNQDLYKNYSNIYYKVDYDINNLMNFLNNYDVYKFNNVYLNWFIDNRKYIPLYGFIKDNDKCFGMLLGIKKPFKIHSQLKDLFVVINIIVKDEFKNNGYMKYLIMSFCKFVYRELINDDCYGFFSNNTPINFSGLVLKNISRIYLNLSKKISFINSKESIKESIKNIKKIMILKSDNKYLIDKFQTIIDDNSNLYDIFSYIFIKNYLNDIYDFTFIFYDLSNNFTINLLQKYKDKIKCDVIYIHVESETTFIKFYSNLINTLINNVNILSVFSHIYISSFLKTVIANYNVDKIKNIQKTFLINYIYSYNKYLGDKAVYFNYY